MFKNLEKEKNGLYIVIRPTFVCFVIFKYLLLFEFWPFKRIFENLNYPSLNFGSPAKNNPPC